MIKNDIIQTNLEEASSSDLRALFRLSSGDELVHIAADLFSVQITHIVKSNELRIGSETHFKKEYQPVNKDTEQKLKTLLSRHANSVYVYGITTDVKNFKASKPDVTFNQVHKIITRACIELDNGNVLSLSLELRNFDMLFVNQLNAASLSKERLVSQYQSELDSARKNATANEFWKASAAGDVEQLSLLFNEFKTFDINYRYKEHSIIDAMFNADPQFDRPLNVEPDYRQALTLLLRHGLDKNLIESASQKYQTAQSNLWFFQGTNPVHEHILAILNDINLQGCNVSL